MFGTPLIPYESNLSNSISWSIMSYAFDKSKDNPMTWRPLSKASCILSIEDGLAVTVYLFFLNPFCASVNILFWIKNGISLLYINFSNILEKAVIIYWYQHFPSPDDTHHQYTICFYISRYIAQSWYNGIIRTIYALALWI
jgi:hypothetical protein